MQRAELRNILTIARHEYAVNVRRFGFIFVTLLIPALGALSLVIFAFFSGQAANFFSSQFGGAGSATRAVGVVDQSGLIAPAAFQKPQFAGHFVAFPDETAARQA